MTDKLRQRARELSEDARYRLEDMGVTNAIEAAILQGMREALREEPDIKMGYITPSYRTKAIEIFKLMAESRARGLE